MKPWHQNGNISYKFYRQLYPTSEEPPKFYGLPKVHKPDLPLRPIVSGIGSVSEGCAKHLSNVLNCVKGKNPHSIRNSQDFAQKTTELEVPPANMMVSFDVTALFTSIPIDYAIQAVKRKLEADPSWQQLTELSLSQILTLLELCLSTTYFIYKGQFYRQKFGAPMGSPISPGVADLSMEFFEEEALRVCPRHLQPRIWLRYVDDTFTILHEYAIEEFTSFLNQQNQHIQFTRELSTDGSLPFLDVCVHVEDDATLKTTVYRKPTHTDQYLNWKSNHPLEHKRSVVRTLYNRASSHCTKPEDEVKEKSHVQQVLKANGYQEWAFNIPLRKPAPLVTQPATQLQPRSRQPPIPLPYVQGLSEELKRIYGEHGVQVYHKPINTLKSILVHPKDKTSLANKCGAIYNMPCDTCEGFYIGETERSLGTRYKEHTRTHPGSAVREHMANTGHSFSFDDLTILGREPGFNARKIKEALAIYKHRPTLNRDQGVEVPPIMLSLLNTPPPPAASNIPTARGSALTVNGTRYRTNSL